MATGLGQTRKLTIIAQDPGLRNANGLIVTTQIDIPDEDLQPGPLGTRVYVLDYDASTDTLYRPLELGPGSDPYKTPQFDDTAQPEHNDHYNQRLLTSPKFHCQNVYAIVMRVLSRFEFALGRRIRWSFGGPQLIVAPHAFSEANAFYAREQRALLFGYFPSRKTGYIFTCLAHDVIAHETTHALLDGLRARYIDPSSPEQAAFHEGFADIVAILSILSLREVVSAVGIGPGSGVPTKLIKREDVSVEKLRNSKLLSMADQIGKELSEARGKALRHSAELPPNPKYRENPEFEESHRRGEILVAAVLNAFLRIWVDRINAFETIAGGFDSERVVQEGAEIADYLLTMCIRAIDYAPPTDVLFRDYLSAVLTADAEIHPNDSKYKFRATLKDVFKSYGIEPTSNAPDGLWEPPDDEIKYDRIHYAALQSEPDEVFRFIWHNRGALKVHEEAYTRVISVRPCLRVGPDGFSLRETVAEYVQTIELRASELSDLGITKPPEMDGAQRLLLQGGGSLIFDEFCRLKYHVRNRIANAKRQTERLDYLWRSGYFLAERAGEFNNFASMHRMRFSEI